MPSFQIRYIGPQAPEPETLIADTVAHVVAKARSRLSRHGPVEAVILFDGAVVQTVSDALDEHTATEETRQRYASAGIYLLAQD